MNVLDSGTNGHNPKTNMHTLDGALNSCNPAEIYVHTR